MTNAADSADTGRKLTGRMVLIILLAFFGTVIAVNMTLLRFAISTFSGIGEKNAYMAGVSHDRQLAAARAQDQRAWTVDAKLQRVGAGRTLVSVQRMDAGAQAEFAVLARFEHPSDGRQDREAALEQAGPLAWRGVLDLPAGAWDLTIEMRAGDAVLFRSRNRVQVDDRKIEQQR
ncbi:MAG: fixH [Hyphomicrobiales bacterium]|nr:fixH [Hyphomicrobiales bacterium]